MTPAVYLAPMEGITTHVYRRAQAAVYGPLDKYFTPFLEPHEKRSFKEKERDEILPAHNEGLRVIPQILTNRAEGFLELAGTLQEFGYGEVNLNLGCPSKTVTAKGKGSGFLAYPEELDRFLDAVFSGLPEGMRLSVKTRIGVESPEEFPGLLDIYGKYPLEELIVHARLQKDYYKKKPRLDAFRLACEKSPAPVCYNGDLFTREQTEQFLMEFPKSDRLMIGRGLLVNPGLAVRLLADWQDGEPSSAGAGAIDALREEEAEKERFRQFHALVLEGYKQKNMGDRNVLFKMKELWFYQIRFFVGAEKYGKRIRKAQRLPEYEAIVRELLETAQIQHSLDTTGFGD